jgi:hypothetical protein
LKMKLWYRASALTVANPMFQCGVPRCKRRQQLSPGGKPSHEAHDALGYPRVPMGTYGLTVSLRAILSPRTGTITAPNQVIVQGVSLNPTTIYKARR